MVFVDGVENGAVTIQLADFGHSSAVPDEAPDLHVILPESRPWSIPPNEYRHTGFHLLDAQRAMSYSCGVCFLWLLFYNHPAYAEGDFADDVLSLDSSTMLAIARTKLQQSNETFESIKGCLSQLFELTLAAEPSARPTSIDTPLQILRDCFEACTKDDDPDPPCVTEKPLAVAPSMTYDAIRKIPDVLNWFDVRASTLPVPQSDILGCARVIAALRCGLQSSSHDFRQSNHSIPGGVA